MAKLQNSRRQFSLKKFLSIEVIGQYVATSPVSNRVNLDDPLEKLKIDHVKRCRS